jgi:nucleotide-binding universal stress UspA family protein
MSKPVIPGSVVVGVDGSAGSDIAVVWAATHAEAQRRPLSIVHGAGVPGVTDLRFDHVEARRSLRMAGRRVTDAALGLARRTSPRLTITVHLALQDPRDLLLTMAADGSLLVLGARGHGSVATLLLGSVSTALSTLAPGPVVIARAVPGRDEEDARMPVVVGVDGSDASTGAVRLAFETASWEHRPLLVVHAVGEPPVYGYGDALTDGQARHLRTERERLLAESLAGYAEKFPDVSMRTTLVMQSPARALRWTSECAYAVFVGTRGHGPVAGRLLGSVSRSLVEHAHCTVAVVPGGAS